MSIWKKQSNLIRLNKISENTLVAHLGIEYTQLGDDFIEATMPVDSRTHQPYGLLHGGASVVLAETLGSVAANLAAAQDKICVGTEINASHLRSMKSGVVIGRATAIRIGRTNQVWNIEIKNERGQLICSSRLTVAVIDRPTQ